MSDGDRATIYRRGDQCATPASDIRFRGEIRPLANCIICRGDDLNPAYKPVIEA